MADFSKYTGSGQGEDAKREQAPQEQLRPQAEKERAPSYFQRSQEKEGRSEWSGGTWSGRSR